MEVGNLSSVNYSMDKHKPDKRKEKNSRAVRKKRQSFPGARLLTLYPREPHGKGKRPTPAPAVFFSLPSDNKFLLVLENGSVEEIKRRMDSRSVSFSISSTTSKHSFSLPMVCLEDYKEEVWRQHHEREHHCRQPRPMP